MLDGNSEIGAHAWREIYLSNLFRSKAVSNLKFLLTRNNVVMIFVKIYGRPVLQLLRTFLSEPLFIASP